MASDTDKYTLEGIAVDLCIVAASLLATFSVELPSPGGRAVAWTMFGLLLLAMAASVWLSPPDAIDDPDQPRRTQWLAATRMSCLLLAFVSYFVLLIPRMDSTDGRILLLVALFAPWIVLGAAMHHSPNARTARSFRPSSKLIHQTLPRWVAAAAVTLFILLAEDLYINRVVSEYRFLLLLEIAIVYLPLRVFLLVHEPVRALECISAVIALAVFLFVGL